MSEQGTPPRVSLALKWGGPVELHSLISAESVSAHDAAMHVTWISANVSLRGHDPATQYMFAKRFGQTSF